MMRKVAGTWHDVKFSEAASVLEDDTRVRTSLMNAHGLTVRGHEEFWHLIDF